MPRPRFRPIPKAPPRSMLGTPLGSPSPVIDDQAEKNAASGQLGLATARVPGPSAARFQPSGWGGTGGVLAESALHAYGELDERNRKILHGDQA